jgi:hypothetical protein
MDRNRKRWTTSDTPAQAGRRALVTGANSGIGFHIALVLARKGAAIIMPTRTQTKADEAMRRICKEVPAAKLTPEILDLSDLGSVRSLVERFLKRFASALLDCPSAARSDQIARICNHQVVFARMPSKDPACPNHKQPRRWKTFLQGLAELPTGAEHCPLAFARKP